MCRSAMWGSGSELIATAQYSGEQHTAPLKTAAPVKRLRHGVVLHGAAGPNSTVLGLPSALQTGTFYIQAAENASLLEVQVHVPAKAYLLVPALQPLPFCLSETWKPIKGAEVKVRWSGFTLKQRAWLNFTNQRQAYAEQSFLLYKYTSRAGLLLSDETLQLPLLNSSAVKSPAWLHFQPIVCLRPRSAHAVGSLSWSGDGSAGFLSPGKGLPQADPATCSMQLIYNSLESGVFDVSELKQHQADIILQRVMAAADDELLLMLVEAETLMCCSMTCLERLLEYARALNLPYLAELVLTQTKVELTKPVLKWLVDMFVASRSLIEAENLLSSYIVRRRNPLSSIAAVEHALFKAATSGLVEDADTMQLAMQFRAAKHALLQQLVLRYAEDQQAVACNAVDGTLNETASVVARQTSSAPVLVDPLLLAVNMCMQELNTPVLGRGTGSGRFSIHDSSPYRIALELHDAAFFSLPAIMDYTRFMWVGRDFYRMHIAIWQQQVAADFSAFGASSLRSSGAAIPHEVNCAGKALTRSQADDAIGAVPEQFEPSSIITGSSACKGPGPCAEGAEGRAGTPSIYRPAKMRTTQQTVGSNISSATHRSAVLLKHSGLGSSSSGRATTAAAWSGASEAESPWLQLNVLLEMMQNLGLAGRNIGSSLARYGCLGVYGLLVAPRGMLHSPRGWWMAQLVAEALFMYCYMVLVLTKRHTGLCVLGVTTILLGNFVNIGFQIRYKYGGSMALYLKDHWNKMDIVMALAMLGGMVRHIQIFVSPNTRRLVQWPIPNVQTEKVVASASAVLVWSRALMLLNPISSKLGAMLYTLRRAAEEAVVMVPVLLVLLVGFGTTLTVVYNSTIPHYSTLIGSIRTLVGITGSDLKLSEFETEAAMSNRFLLVYGQVVVILYIIVVNILIMTLLIAMINHTYQPEVVKSQAVLMQAESVFDYDWHVLYGLSCTPTNAFQLLSCYLTTGFRSRVLPSTCLKWWIPPLDGYVPESIAGAPAMLLATGPSEISNLAFLIFIYPLTAIPALILLVLHVPFGIAHFATEGYKLWWDSPWDKVYSKVYSGGEQAAPAPESSARRPRPGFTACGSPAGDRRLSKAANGPQLNTASLVPHSCSGVHGAVVVQRGYSHKVQQPEPSRTHHCAQAVSQSLLYCVNWVSKQVLKAVNLPLAILVGLIAHTLLLSMLVLTLLWALITRIVYAVYCINFPAAANSNCCLRHTRSADFWGEDSVYAAFEAAGITVMSVGGSSSMNARTPGSMVGSVVYSTEQKRMAGGGAMRSAQSTSEVSSSTTTSSITAAMAAWENNDKAVCPADAAGSVSLRHVQCRLPAMQLSPRPACQAQNEAAVATADTADGSLSLASTNSDYGNATVDITAYYNPCYSGGNSQAGAPSTSGAPSMHATGVHESQYQVPGPSGSSTTAEHDCRLASQVDRYATSTPNQACPHGAGREALQIDQHDNRDRDSSTHAHQQQVADSMSPSNQPDGMQPSLRAGAALS